jgi:hypothetical protein
MPQMRSAERRGPDEPLCSHWDDDLEDRLLAILVMRSHAVILFAVSALGLALSHPLNRRRPIRLFRWDTATLGVGSSLIGS